MTDPTHKDLKKEWKSYEEYERWLQNNTYEKAKAKQSPNQIATTETAKETREQDTTKITKQISRVTTSITNLKVLKRVFQLDAVSLIG